MKKRYKLESGMDTSITLEIDTDKIPEERAREINAFWTKGDYILDLSGGRCLPSRSTPRSRAAAGLSSCRL